MPITITAFKNSPDGGQGMARDMRVRWALEEVGQPYEVRLLTFPQMKQPGHLALQPFGQIPTYEDGDLSLFESGAIILHIAQTYAGLLPDDANARARAIAWMFAAQTTVEPPIVEREAAILTEGDKPWHDQRMIFLDERICTRLDQLSRWLNGRDWLENDFSAGDLMMVSALQRLNGEGLRERYPDLERYVARAEGRPAFRRAFDAQLAVFIASQSAG
ncbi:glutathione S-transferase family protein [Paracoccus pacificus]|uniref:Glutathione S-transferase family protein n=1 Tax=Paracoccus pacificus TaxID=1463598 RepID=A0ABW4R2F9_9RHOB